MPIFHDRIADQIEELLPEFYQREGPRFISFIKAYFEFLEKGQLLYKDAADIDYIGLEDGTVAGDAYNADGQRGNLIQEPGTYAPSSVTTAKFNYEVDIDGYLLNPENPEKAKTSFESGEYVVGSKSGATARIDVIGTGSNLYIEQFTEAQFKVDEEITGMTSGMTAKVSSFKASPLHATSNLLSYADVDKTSGDFLEYFRRDFMPFVSREALENGDGSDNERLIQKHIKDLYLSKGTKESVEFLFRMLYGTEAEVVYPGDNVIKPSESEFSQPTVMRLYSTKDLTKYKGGTVKVITGAGAEATASAYIDDASGMSGTNDATNAYEFELVTPYVGTFSVGDSVTISERDGLRIDATATVRGVMSDIDPDESSIYVGLEDGQAGDIEDVIRLEDAESLYIVNEDSSGDNLLSEASENLILDYSLGSQNYEVQSIQLETGAGIGILLSEASVYDTDNNLVTDYALLHENTDLYPTLPGAPDSRRMGGGVYGENVSLGALFEESDTFNYKSAPGGTATQSIQVIGSIGRGSITDIIIDDAGSGYSTDDMVVFVNSDTEGSHAEAKISVTEGSLELEAATTPGIFTFTGDGSNTVFQGLSAEARTIYDQQTQYLIQEGLDGTQDDNIISEDGFNFITEDFTAGKLNPGFLAFDPRKVRVFTGANQAGLAEQTRGSAYTTDQTGRKVTFTTAPTNSHIVEIHSSHRGIELQDKAKEDGSSHNIVRDDTGVITKIEITNPGLNYKSLPKVFMGGYIYYDSLTSGTTLPVGNTVSDGTRTNMIVVKHDTEKKRILVYKQPTTAAGVPSGTITMTGLVAGDNGGSSSTSFTIKQTNVTAGSGAKLWAFGNDIGSIKELKMQDVGHDFDIGGIGNYLQHLIVKDVSSALTVNTTVTAALTGSQGVIKASDTGLNKVTLKNVKGIFNDGDYCTTSDSKNFVIGKTNPCTARGKLSGTALYDGNYTNDTGFPSVDSMRIHDSKQYQDFSFKIKAGNSINEYRSIVKSLIQPAGTIMFGEVAFRTLLDATPDMYNVNFDGTNTARSFIPRLVIGSKVDAADIQLEDGTYSENDQVFSSYEGRLQIETGEGVLTTERFLCTDTTAANHNTHTVKDQGSGNRIYIPDIDRDDDGNLVTPITETDRDFFERQLTAEATPIGNRVTKEIEIYPAYNQHKISYGTLSNALAVGTRVRGATSNALGIVMQHDTTNKFIIVHRDILDWGQAGSQFTGTEIIQNTAASTNYFTATSIELHWTPEDIVTKQDPASITADTTITSANQKISNGVEGGGDAYDHTNYISGFQGRGRVLTANDPNETYDSEMRQRKVNIISSPIFTQATTQRGRAYSAGVKQVRTLNTQNSRTLGSNTTANNSNGSALRIDSAFNTTPKVGVSFGHRPAGQKLFETTNFLSERIVSESQEPIVAEPDHGNILQEDYPSIRSGIILLEDNTGILFEDATVADETFYFVSEESTQLGSFNIISEAQDDFNILLEDGESLLHEDGRSLVTSESIFLSVGVRLIDETDSLPLLKEDALMIGQKESNQTGPSIGDLKDMIFTDNYSNMKNLRQESGSAGSSNLGDDFLFEDGTTGVVGEKILMESPSEGLRISDISNIYSDRFVSGFERELGRKTNFTHSAVIRSG